MTVCIYKITNDRTRMNEEVVVGETFTGDTSHTRVNGSVGGLDLLLTGYVRRFATRSAFL